MDSVYEKLAKDPMMTKTFDLGNQEHFNDDFKNEEEKFTYLVPTDNAWEEVQQEMATAHKVFFFNHHLQGGFVKLDYLRRSSSWGNSSISLRRY